MELSLETRREAGGLGPWDCQAGWEKEDWMTYACQGLAKALLSRPLRWPKIQL